MRHWNPDATGRFVRCGHGWCTDCKTKRGRNRGNRRVRRAARNALRALAR